MKKYAEKPRQEEKYVRRAYTYVPLVSENPHPLKKVPGAKKCYWDAYIGRWVKVPS